MLLKQHLALEGHLHFLLVPFVLIIYVACAFHSTFQRTRANQPVHWFFEGKGLGIQQGTSVWVGLSKSILEVVKV